MVFGWYRQARDGLLGRGVTDLMPVKIVALPREPRYRPQLPHRLELRLRYLDPKIVALLATSMRLRPDESSAMVIELLQTRDPRMPEAEPARNAPTPSDTES